jgi:SAM-dependent methyltransferase
VFLGTDTDQQRLLDYYRGGHFRNEYLPDIKNAESKEAEKFYSLKQPLQEKRFHILRDVFDKDMEVLDVGCATAGFLYILKDHVEKVKGIELYEPHKEFARERLGLDVEMRDVEEIEDESFDVICLFHVLEHVANPAEFLGQVYKKLKIKGLLIIEVPDVDDSLISIYDVSPYKDFYFMKPHIFYFCERSIGLLLNKVGFNRIEFRSYQHYGLMNHLCWILTGETCTATKVGGGEIEFPPKYMDEPLLEKVMPFFQGMNSEYKRMLESIGKTDTLLVLGRKGNG